jgi:hypothetical protein
MIHVDDAKLAAPVIVKLLGALVIKAFARAIGGLRHNPARLPSSAVQKLLRVSDTAFALVLSKG